MDRENGYLSESLVFVDQVPPMSGENLEGYLQISLTKDGRLSLRGSRLFVEWFLQQLAAKGWVVEFDNLRWCG